MASSGKKWESIEAGEFPGFLTHEIDMFIGEYRHVLDEKGRVSVPVKFRGDAALGLVITRGLDRSLFLYPKKEWERLAEKLAALPLGQADTRAFARFMLAGAMEVDIDKSGRITIPPYLRDYAEIKKRVVLTGLFNRIEIWDEANWDTYASKTEAEGNDIAERLGSQGV